MEAYPLSWPLGIKRTPVTRQTRSRFRVTSLSQATKRLFEELRKLQATNVILSTNVPVKSNGMPYATHGYLADPGAAVYFCLNKRNYAMPCDRWSDVAHNVYAIACHIGAMRSQSRWGVASVEQAFAGFKALGSGGSHWTEVLGVKSDSSEDEINSAYKRLAREMHPDLGGSGDSMSRLNAARDEALKAAHA